MSPTPDQTAPDAPPPPGAGGKAGRRRPRRARRAGGAGLLLLLALVLALAAGGLVALRQTGLPLRLPDWTVALAEERLNRDLAGLPGAPALAVGGAVVQVGRDWEPRLRLEDLRLIAADGRTLGRLPHLGLAFDGAALAQGRVQPVRLILSGAQARLRRLPDGRLDLAFLGNGLPVANLAELLGRIDAILALPALSRLSRIDAEAMTLTLEDQRSGRLWQVGDGRLSLTNRPEALAVELGFGLMSGAAGPARASLTARADRAQGGARLTAEIQDVAAADLAAQSPVLAWLGVIEAPISGRIAARLGADGRLADLTGGLEIGAGALHPTPAATPVRFDRAGMTLAYDAATETFRFSDLRIEGPALRLRAEGVTRAPGLARGLPGDFIVQARIADLALDPAGLFQAPVRFADASVDLRLRLDPFSVDLGQLTLRDGDLRAVTRGRLTAGAAGWHLRADLSADAVAADRLLTLWPPALAARTRDWLAQNVIAADLTNLRAGIELRQGERPRLAAGFDFARGRVQVLRTMPPVTDARGHATLAEDAFTLVLDRGRVTAPQGGDIDLSGSTFRVPDTRARPSRGEVTAVSDGPLTATLALLDRPPLHLLTKAGRPVDLAQGRALLRTDLRLPLVPRVPLKDIDFRVTGQLRDVQSDRLVPGRAIAAPVLTVAADPARLRLSGAGTLGLLPFDAVWTQPLGPGAEAGSRVEGRATLDPAALADLGVALPAGMVSGAGPAEVTVDLPRGAPPRLRLSSDLTGLGLAIPELAWSKPAATPGRLDLTADLGTPPRIETLEIEAPGLSARGSLTLRPGGGLDRASFDPAAVGRWFQGGVVLTGQGAGRPPGIEITGGRLDLRAMPRTDGARPRGPAGPPIPVRLDRLEVSDTIALTGLTGRFSGTGGLNGDFTARVNGAAAITGEVTPAPGGSAIRIRSQDAGGVMAAAGIFARARGGALDLTLTPGETPGETLGDARVTNLTVRDMPVLAALLNAISVVGLIEQLNAQGLVFAEAQARFRLIPEGVEIRRASAVGASLGVSMEGVYDQARRRIRLRGVISPVYLLNGIGAILTRRGEGLFGFNYRVQGPVEAPEVSVNPLSILTPGMFRELFRGPAPQLGN